MSSDKEKAPTEDVVQAVKEIFRPPENQYCPGCGARYYSCWCGESQAIHISEYRGDRR